METKKTLRCTNCNSILDVDELLINQFQESIKKDLQSELDRREQDLKKQKELFSKQSLKLEKEKEEVQKLIDSKVSTQLKSKEQALKDSIRKELKEERSLQLQELEDELKEKSKQLIELNQTKAKMQRLSREYEEKESKIHAEYEDKLQKKLVSLESDMKDKLDLQNSVKLQEKQNIIDSLTRKLDEASKRASSIGSQQNQGESLEIIAEDILKNGLDSIEEIKKGQRGGDIIQYVKSKDGKNMGSILYEIKRVSKWSDSFLKKIRQDNLSHKCDLMVIVSTSLPSDMKSKYMLKEKIWLTSPEHLSDLSLLLRFGLIKTQSVIQAHKNSKEKMAMLYNYLSSESFRATFENILQGFKSLQDSHHEEQRKLQLLWKKRSQHLESVLSSTIEFYGSIKSISENSIPTIEMLEIKDAA